MNVEMAFFFMRAAVVIMAAAGVLIGVYSTWRDLHEDD